MVKTFPNLLGFIARLVCVFGVYREGVSGTYRNGLLRIELVVRAGQLIRKESYPTTVA